MLIIIEIFNIYLEKTNKIFDNKRDIAI